jgi:hypothetical protein
VTGASPPVTAATAAPPEAITKPTSNPATNDLRRIQRFLRGDLKVGRR